MPAWTRKRPLFGIFAAVLLAAPVLLGTPAAQAKQVKVDILVGPEDPTVLEDFYVDDGPLDAKKVGFAMKRGVTWLRRKQGRSGSWGKTLGNARYGGGGIFDGLRAADESLPGANPAGPTALALYALLRARVALDDPVVVRGFAFLAKKHKRPGSAFETSMVLLALTATAEKQRRSKITDKVLAPRLPRRYRRWACQLRERLVERHGKRQRGWRYNYEGQAASPGGPEDLSSTWLAALALFEAHRLGIRTGERVWQDLLAFTLEQQEDDGPDVKYVDPTDPKRTIETRARGFAYIKGLEGADLGQATGGMTACAVATIAMARFILSDLGRKGARWVKQPDAKRAEEALFDGLAWLKHNWQPHDNPHKGRSNVNHGYWWFALESAMSLSAIKHIGRHPWFTETGQALVNKQRKAGHWDTQSSVAPTDTLDTCFALLTLGRNAHGLIPYPSVRGGRWELPP